MKARIYNDKKQYRCETCSKTFLSQNGYLKLHEITHFADNHSLHLQHATENLHGYIIWNCQRKDNYSRVKIIIAVTSETTLLRNTSSDYKLFKIHLGMEKHTCLMTQPLLGRIAALEPTDTVS